MKFLSLLAATSAVAQLEESIVDTGSARPARAKKPETSFDKVISLNGQNDRLLKLRIQRTVFAHATTTRLLLRQTSALAPVQQTVKSHSHSRAARSPASKSTGFCRWRAKWMGRRSSAGIFTSSVQLLTVAGPVKLAVILTRSTHQSDSEYFN